MTLVDAKAWTVLVGAVVGAITGLVTLTWKILDRRTRVTLNLGPETFSLDQLSALHVSNNGARPVRISDYGLILFSGELYSFPFQSQVDTGVSIYTKGETALLPYQVFEAGADINGRVAGVYCRMIEGRLLTRFYQSVSTVDRLRLRVNIWRIST